MDRPSQSNNADHASPQGQASDSDCIELEARSTSAHPLRKRLWLAGLALGLFIATMAVGNFFVAPDKAVSRQSAGHDFLAFYTAGTFVRTGRSADLYDLAAVKSFQRELALREQLELGPDNFGPFWNPPFFAWVFVPLSSMSYATAWNLWFCINLLAAAGAIVILSRMIEGDWRDRGLVPLLIVTSLPFIQALGHGQNTCISLLLLSGTIALWRSDRLIAAGAVAGLLFYKPQLGALVAGALVLREGYKPLAGLAITGSILLLATLITLPGALSDFLHKLPGNVIYMQIEHRYLWDRHVTLKSFWRLLFQGFAVGDMSPLTRTLYLATTALAATCLFAVILKQRRNRDAATRDALIAATIAAMPLLMPFYFDYDLLLLAVPAVLVAQERKLTRPLLFGWIALFAWLFVNSAIAERIHVNGTVILVCGVTSMLIARAWRGAAQLEQTIDRSPALRQAA